MIMKKKIYNAPSTEYLPWSPAPIMIPGSTKEIQKGGNTSQLGDMPTAF